MKKSILSLVVATGALIAAPAMAADLRMPVKAPLAPIAPVFSWSGCYIGADVGGAWGHENANNNNPTILTGVNQAADFVTLNGSSVIGGGFVGCNMQFNSIVVGIEGDWSGTHIADTEVGPNLFANGLPTGSGSVSFSRTVDWLASIRGRIGYTFTPNTLVYFTGGGAWAKTDFSGLDAFIGGCPNCVSTAFSSTVTGWVIGGGLEWAWSSNWLVRAEYLHYDMQGATSAVALFGPPFPPTPGAQFFFGRDQIDEFRVGLSYKFNVGGPVEARY
jgi:outer membrane immunogenic protein